MKRQVFTMANDYQTQALDQVANLLLDRTDANHLPIARTRALMHELMAVPNPDFTMLSVAMRELRGLSDQAD